MAMFLRSATLSFASCISTSEFARGFGFFWGLLSYLWLLIQEPLLLTLLPAYTCYKMWRPFEQIMMGK